MGVGAARRMSSVDWRIVKRNDVSLDFDFSGLRFNCLYDGEIICVFILIKEKIVGDTRMARKKKNLTILTR